MKHIISLNYSGFGENGDQKIIFSGQDIRITQFNLGFDYELSLNIIKEYDGVVDAFALSGIPPVVSFKKGGFVHPQVNGLKAAAKETPMLDGSILKRTYLPWSLRKFHLKNPKIFGHKKIGVYAGAFHHSLLDEMESFGGKLRLGDPYFFLGLPFVLNKKKKLDRFLKLMAPVFKKKKIKKSNLTNFQKKSVHSRSLAEFFTSDIFVGNESTFSLLDTEHLKGKTVLVDYLSNDLKTRFAQAGVRNVVVSIPNILGLEKMNFSMIEACLQSVVKSEGVLAEDDIIAWMEENGLNSQIIELGSGYERQNEKFAFIIHPLSRGDLFKHPMLGKLKPISKGIGPLVEDLLSYIPGYYYGKIRGIKSEKNGKIVEGLIYMVPNTPKVLLEKDVNTIYNRLVNLADMADKQGAGIIGLGAYTKIVGDAGVTVDSRSPIPVTTGNSLSACATLWAAKFALERMNLTPFNNGRYQGRVMVVGATGSIGAVSAKVLAKSWKEIVLVAPRAYKVLELKEEIRKIDSEVSILVSTNANTYSGESDLIITTTSAQGKKVLDIDMVKPGAIICDVSRPFDIKEEDALKRPDVMVIASGEVKLPGPIDFTMDIGLEGNIVYACLAETALLSMEGKYESFTLSRNISYEKVLEIDRMANDHGVRLSCIMGHSGYISDEEFSLCREHALEALPLFLKRKAIENLK